MVSITLDPQYLNNKKMIDKDSSINNDDDRFIKLINDRDNEKTSYKIIDDYINFKKRKSYSYNHYKNFNNKKSKNKFEVNNSIYNNIIESKNYPEIQIDINYSNKIINETKNNFKHLNNINKPITSYGIILYTYEKNKHLKYLVCQRRDSISYIQFLQDLIDDNNMLKYINLMSKEEKERCLEYYYKNDAHSIWKDLWINNNSKIYKNEYKRCTETFIKNMEKYLDYFKDETIGQKENSWCFPKGRMNYNETEIECALREFEEETGISSDKISINTNINFEEIYIGSNNLLYKTIYYTAYIPYIPIKIYKYYPTNIRKKFISPEFYDIEWLDYQSAIEKLNGSKKSVLEKINKFILKRSFKK